MLSHDVIANQALPQCPTIRVALFGLTVEKHMQPVLACAAFEAVLFSWLAPVEPFCDKFLFFSVGVCTLPPCITGLAELCE